MTKEAKKKKKKGNAPLKYMNVSFSDDAACKKNGSMARILLVSRGEKSALSPMVRTGSLWLFRSGKRARRTRELPPSQATRRQPVAVVPSSKVTVTESFVVV